ncbi:MULTISPECIES: DUF1214 domain-containing protein [unclassified Roseitalea]|uniref:DUF1214 domain-containing protein n=1 Tax=unclassified Roseitalea TaxID=2639107 RepID=UPI00273F183C|nr:MULTISPECIES: DUF1214 domain-containing protein [unclassified Roseitalea]
MIRDLTTMLIAMAIALGLGAYTAERTTRDFAGFGALTLGLWTAYPDAGTRQADPYAMAGAARRTELSLGDSEGLAFTAGIDLGGRALSGRCAYRIEGGVPSARLWTLRMTDAAGRDIVAPPGLTARTHSRAIVRPQEQGEFVITVSDTAQTGNWLHLDHGGPIRFVLTLYDTTVAGAMALTELSMPTIRRMECRS